jgi:hypothetical protein
VKFGAWGTIMKMTSVVFWVVTRRLVVIVYIFFRISGGDEKYPPYRGVLIVYHTSPCNNPEDRRLYQHRGGSLKSR